MMGPDCGTAVLDGVPLGFANVLRPGPVGIVAASGTGAQEVSCLLDRAGVGNAALIGVGGRDLIGGGGRGDDRARPRPARGGSVGRGDRRRLEAACTGGRRAVARPPRKDRRETASRSWPACSAWTMPTSRSSCARHPGGGRDRGRPAGRGHAGACGRRADGGNRAGGPGARAVHRRNARRGGQGAARPGRPACRGDRPRRRPVHRGPTAPDDRSGGARGADRAGRGGPDGRRGAARRRARPRRPPRPGRRGRRPPSGRPEPPPTGRWRSSPRSAARPPIRRASTPRRARCARPGCCSPAPTPPPPGWRSGSPAATDAEGGRP